jgi:hypothetical protein
MRTVTYAATAFGFVAVVVCAARSFGFVAISDDDYCRVTIAQRFSVDPHLDPSGTSWLPAPFWILGAALMAFGRSLDVARAAAPIMAALALAPWLYALRRDRERALVALALTLAVDWVAWVAATPVPEALVGPLVAAPFVAAEEDSPWAYVPGLLVATLARYEAWPLAAAASALWLARRGVRALAPATAALAGVTGWIGWNAFAHGDSLHFLARVARYADALAHGHGGARRDDGRALGALVAMAVVAALPALPARKTRGRGDAEPMEPRPLRASGRGPALAALALAAFLELGAWRSGVPTHHAVRALIPLAWLASPLVVFALTFLAGRRRAPEALAHLAACALVLACGRFTLPPGTGSEDRTEALRIGAEARANGERSLHVASCAFEHFATMAAFGAPERVTVTAQRPGGPCPERLPAEGQAPAPELR